MKITLSEFLRKVAKLPSPETCGGRYRIVFRNAPMPQLYRVERASPAVLDIVDFSHDGNNWQVSAETPVTFVP